MPTISVIMPAYNAAKYLREAVDSILHQTFTDFELIVIDDCSTDETPDILASYDDPRLRVLRNEKNMERSFSKNRGIAESKADLIAFLDADDIAHPDRLAVQSKFMKDNPDICLVSCQIRVLGTDVVFQQPSSHEDIHASMLFGCPIAQSGVMLRKHALLAFKELYRDLPIPSEDYDFWARIVCFSGNRIAIIPKVLVDYRVINANNQAYIERQRIGAQIALRTMLESFGLYPDDMEFNIHYLLSTNGKLFNAQQILWTLIWLRKILSYNVEKCYFSQQALTNAVSNIWFDFCHRAAKQYFRASWYYFISELSPKPRACLRSLRMLLKTFYYKLKT